MLMKARADKQLVVLRAIGVNKLKVEAPSHQTNGRPNRRNETFSKEQDVNGPRIMISPTWIVAVPPQFPRIVQISPANKSMTPAFIAPPYLVASGYNDGASIPNSVDSIVDDASCKPICPYMG